MYSLTKYLLNKIRLNFSYPYLCTPVLWLKHKEEPEDKKMWKDKKITGKRQRSRKQLRGSDPATLACLYLFQNTSAT